MTEQDWNSIMLYLLQHDKSYKIYHNLAKLHDLKPPRNTEYVFCKLLLIDIFIYSLYISEFSTHFSLVVALTKG
jgi:hypothetical protein